MNIDWTKYPPLPPAPELPEWRDTPEREAYFQELNDHMEFPKISWFGYVTGVFLLICGLILIHGSSYQSIGIATAFEGIAVLLFFWLFWRFYLAVKYRIFPMKLKRPDISKKVEAIMAARPDFDEAELRKYWPTERHADMALKILGWVRENWAIPEKMLYPNDFLMIFYEYKLTGDDEDFEDYFAQYYVTGFDLFDYNTTFAELVEMCLAYSEESEKEHAR